jgi:uncharacterized protein with LGFP repeats
MRSAVFKKRPLTLAMAVLALAGSAVAASVPAEAAGYTTGGATGALYNAQGRTIGAPTSNEYTGHADRVQNFQYGLIYWSPATGAHSVRGAILGEYRRLGTDAGKLGLPITEEKRTVGGGVYQQFKGGIIYWTPANGAHAVVGAIRSLYAQAGAERGTMGFPTSAEISVKNAGASFVYQTFEHGMLAWNGVRVPVFNEDPTHAHAVYGDYYKEYLAAGGVRVVGYISSNQGIGHDETGAVTFGGQWFQNGAIVSKTGAGIHYLPNAWLDGLSAQAQETLGYPTSGVHAVAGGTAVTFEHGSVTRGADGVFLITMSTPAPAPTVQSGTLEGSRVPSPTSIIRR